MRCTCPTCGQKLTEVAGIALDYENSVLVVNGAGFDLSPRQADLLKVVLDAHPKTLSVQEIMRRMYGPDGGPVSDQIVRVMVFRLNKMFRHTGLSMSSLPGRGYRIDLERIGVAA